MLSALGQSGMTNPIRAKNRMKIPRGGTNWTQTLEYPQNFPSYNYVIPIRGSGSIMLQVPDGTVARGNPRGPNSIDFQIYRGNATQVNSGTRCGIFGGSSNTISSSSLDSVIIGCNGASILGSSSNCAIIGQAGTITNCINSGILGNGTMTNCLNSFILGSSTVSNVTGSVSIGYNASPNKYGQFTYAAGQFATAGDNQVSKMMLMAVTTDANPVSMSLGNTNNPLFFTANTAGRLNFRLIARTNTATGSFATADRTFSFSRGVAASSSAITAIDNVGTDVGSNAGAWPSGWGFNIAADTTNGGFVVYVTGSAATTIRWGGLVSDYTEIGYP